MWRRWSVLATTAVSVIGIQTAPAAETSNNPAETEEVTVTGEATGSLTSESPEESAKQKPQATTCLDNRDRHTRGIFADSVGVVALSLLAS
jgi:hypothetical protein